MQPVVYVQTMRQILIGWHIGEQLQNQLGKETWYGEIYEMQSGSGDASRPVDVGINEMLGGPSCSARSDGHG
jgi:hypothetical protein